MEITYRGIVYPAQCDAMGHMTVQHIIAVFDQSMWQLVFRLGFKPSWIASRRRGWADVRYVVNFRSELRAGQLFHAESAVKAVGKASLTTSHRIIDSEYENVAAEIEMTSVYFDLARRRSLRLPAAIRTAAKRLLPPDPGGGGVRQSPG